MYLYTATSRLLEAVTLHAHPWLWSGLYIVVMNLDTGRGSGYPLRSASAKAAGVSSAGHFIKLY